MQASIAAAPLVISSSSVAPGRAREMRDGVRRQRGRLDPAHALARERGQDAADLGQRLAAAGDDQAAGRAQQAAAEQRHEVERRVVGPVQVLDHQHGAGGELVERGVEDRLTAAVDHRLQAAAGLTGDVAQRAERARRDQRVAGAPQHRAVVQGLGERADQRGLADPRLAQHERDPTGRERLGQRLREDGPLAFTLQKLQRC